MKIAIIGKGKVGSALQAGATKAGFEVRVTGSDAKEVASAGAWGELIVLAIPAPARQAVVESLGNVKGKTLVDVTNLLNADWSYAGSLTKSGAEQLQEWAPGAHVVKAFNTVFAPHMSSGKVKGEALSALVAGDDAGAKKEVLAFAKAIGFEAVDAGPLTVARYLETLGFLNIQLGFGATNYGTDIGIKVVGVGR